MRHYPSFTRRVRVPLVIALRCSSLINVSIHSCLAVLSSLARFPRLRLRIIKLRNYALQAPPILQGRFQLVAVALHLRIHSSIALLSRKRKNDESGKRPLNFPPLPPRDGRLEAGRSVGAVAADNQNKY